MVKFLVFLFIATPTFACPNLTGLFKGPEAWGDKFHIDIKQENSCEGVTTYSIFYFYGSQKKIYKADGSHIPVETEKFKGVQKYSCENDQFIFEEIGESKTDGSPMSSKSTWSLTEESDLIIESNVISNGQESTTSIIYKRIPSRF